MVNAASYAGAHTTWGTDMSTNTTRDYGGLPDIGAIENHVAGSAEGENANKDGQLAYGGAYYVRDYGSDMTAGGDGSSWANAINGNAYYYPNGTHGASTTITITEGYNEYDTYQPIQGDATALPSTGTKSVFFKNGANYLYYTGSALATTTNINQASVFNITRSGNTGSTYTITVNYNNTKVNVGYTTTGNDRTISFTNASVWTSNGTAGSSKSGNFSFTYRRTNGLNRTRYLNTDVTTSITWSFYDVESETIHHKDPITGTYDGVRGLQYAVNKAHDDFDHEGGTSAQKKLVYVGAGTYTNATGAAAGTTFTSAELAKHLVSQPYAYEIKEGVDVYGGFPATGNPGMSERNPKQYETILQPQTESPYVTMAFPTTLKNSGYDGMNVSNWGSCVKMANGSEKASVGRVLVQPTDFNVQTLWDGFTVRHGYLNTAYMKNIGPDLSQLTPADLKTSGGAGVLLQQNGILSNCVVTENVIICYPNHSSLIKTGTHTNTLTDTYYYTYHMAGAGIFMTGPTTGAIVENCEIGKNEIISKAYKRRNATSNKVPDNLWMYGGGLYQNGGSVYNTISHDNICTTLAGDAGTDWSSGTKPNNEMILGSGAFVAKGKFFNNTIVNNIATSYFQCHTNHCTFAGVHVFDAAEIYNSIICDNVSHWSYEGNTDGLSPGNGVPVSAFLDTQSDRFSRDYKKVHVTYSFLDVNYGESVVIKDNNGVNHDVRNDLISPNDKNHTNIYLNANQGDDHATSPALNEKTQKAERAARTATIYYKADAAGTTASNVYHLKAGSPAINTGTQAIAGVTIPEYDAEYTRRVKDCEIDMGAYEYNGSYAITPDITTYPGTTPETGDAIYYVTPNGMGLSSASNPANAACAGKLQEVLDAAGRYKFQNPGKRVIVKVANAYATANPDNDGLTPDDDDYIEPSDFQYSATRTTDEQDQNSRIWSIMIPHGVEVWGGYTDVNPTSHLSTDLTNEVGKNGFYKKSTQADVDAGLATGTNQTIDARDITGNLTVFSGYFHNSAEGSDAQSYHVVTFTDRIYDPEGKPYLKDDAVTGLSSYDKNTQYTEADFKHMSDETTLINHDGTRDQHRAVIDGIYLTGGNANGEEDQKLNNMGGAAIVTDFAQVRNCIIEDNEAHNGGGLAVLQRGLVSGTLMLNNSAELGGAIYIVPNGTEIAPTLVGSWGITKTPTGTIDNEGNVTTKTPMVTKDDEGNILNDTDAPAGKSMGWNMSHIFTTTIVANTATKQGGGIYYANEGDPNTRVNSTVIWNNDAPDQANVAGIVNPDKPDDNTASTLTFYPFGYSAIQNVRASGTNNIKVEAEATRGVRWSDLNTDPWYGISDYSVLTRTGMPVKEYDDVVSHYNVSHIDFANVDRDIATMAARSFIDMGARAVDKSVVRNELMLRLFVANGDIDNDAVSHMQSINTVKGSVGYDAAKAYYAQEGSSFAFPMQHLQDALDYIYWARSVDPSNTTVLNMEKANNLPFEIIVAKGTYYPTRDLQGNYGESTANTFLIPEGVSIVGGFDYDDVFEYDGDGNVTGKKFYGRYNELDKIKEPEKGPDAATYYIADNVKKVGKTDLSPADYEPADITIDGYTIVHKSLNEMKANRAKADINANNIIEPWEFLNETVLDGDAVNSTHARVYHVLTAYPDESLVGALPMRSIERNTYTYNYDSGDPDKASLKYLDREEGQVINLNGLTVQNGEAYNYIPGSLDEMSAYGYYHGGALFVDGNRYLDQWNKTSADTGNGWSSDGKTRYMHTGASNAVGYRDIPVAISQCKFVNNMAGYGGAISANTTVDIFNSSFEQNMAKAGEENITFNSTGYKIQFPGQGGAVYSTHQFSAFNTIFANNEAIDTKYLIDPQKYLTLRTQDASKATDILGGTGGAIYSGRKGQFHLVNCNLVRNMANAYPAVFTMNPNYAALRDPAGVGATIATPYYNQFVNCIVWGNDINNGMKKYDSSNEYFKFASRLICNYGNKERAGADYDPTFGNATTPMNQSQLDASFEETAWFSAYEDGKGVTQNNTYDFRSADYRPFTHAYVQLSTHVPEGSSTPLPYQNCNVSIDPSNESLEGPNFISPSVEAGYAGYMESADWSPARLNKMTDMGSGKIKQIITIKGENYKSVFPTYKEAFPDKSGEGSEGYTLDKKKPTGRFYSCETVNDVVTAGAYTMTRFMDDYRNYNENLPLGNEFYMESANSSHQQLLRISYDPNPTHNQTFIDIGVYEYPHTELKWTTEGDEVDILWVSAAEKPENGLPEGSDWSQPTSDLQRAIETLLSSRNGHRKEIRLMDGTFAPIYTINDHLSFYIDTKMMNASVMMPVQYELDGHGNIKLDSNGDPIVTGVTEGLGIKSFTIKGGYSSELKNMYDVDQYPAVFRGQRRTNPTSNAWDHLFYINDATQRYGYQNDAQRYGYGNKYGWQGRGETTGIATPSVIPIEIDGVTFVNNQALENDPSNRKYGSGKGAAIYYADQKFKETPLLDEHGDPVTDSKGDPIYDIVRTDEDEYDYVAIAPQPVNIRKITQYYEDEACTIKSDVPTMYFDAVSTPFVLEHPAKFVMSKSKVMNSGTHYESSQDIKTTSAVYIGREGGDAIFYNNVFHSNWGDPLDAYAAKLINNTFALNKGMVRLTDYQGMNNGYSSTEPHFGSATQTNYTSLAYNNVFWENGVAVDGVKQQFLFKHIDESTFNGLSYAALTSVGSFFRNNAYTTDPSVADFTANTDYEKTPGKELYDHYFNVGLVNDNEDVINGPNFAAPNLSAVTVADIEARDFSLRPSLRLLNKGDDALYTDGVSHDDDKVMTFTPAQGNNVYDMAWLTTMGLDAAANKRKHFQIDLGAYEYQNMLERVIYVNPNLSTTGVGNSWASPIGKGNLQPAIDLAAVYAVNHQNDDDGAKEAYVLVKGAEAINAEMHTGETITMRAGVHIYGGINPGKNDDAVKNLSGEYEDATLHTYISNLKAERLGTADMLGFKTRVSGIRTSSATSFNPTGDNRQSLVDGFIVTPDGEATAPAIDVNPNNGTNGAKVALRNIIVSDFDLSSKPSLNVANVDNALLYEALFRDNKVDGSMAVLNMGTKGYGVNLTVDGKTTGTTANIKNSLYNFTDAQRKTFSGWSYPIDDKNLNYQLAEGSKAIDAYAATVPALPADLQGFINYTTDRDLLGNPRVLALSDAPNTLDAGAFETWKVAKDTWANTTPGVYYGNYYPHAGSVVYIEEGKSLISAHEFVPGYLLVKEGASLYGNGHDVKAAYVAIERDVKTTGNVISLPYSMDYKQFDNTAKAGVATTSVDDGTGVLTQDPFAGKNVYRYDGSARAVTQYDFASADSKCWIDASGVIPANEGILYVPNADGTKVRFTGKGTTMTDYIYTETGASKTVTLTQYNDGGRNTHENGNTGDNADFTDNDDMGWNAIGLPYLVSEYKPYQTATTAVHGAANNGKYMMHTPKTLWLWYNGTTYSDGTTPADGDGGFYSVNSWEVSDATNNDELKDTEHYTNPWHVGTLKEQAIWVGEGFFTQTATFDATEDLTFFRPVAPAPVSPAPANKGNGKSNVDGATNYNTRYYVTDEHRNMEEDFTGKQIVATRYYTADGVQHARPVRGVTIQVDIYDDGSRQTRKFSKR